MNKIMISPAIAEQSTTAMPAIAEFEAHQPPAIDVKDSKSMPAFFKKRTWKAFGYHWAMLLLVPFGFSYAVATVALGASLLITVVGLSVASAMLMGARYWGHLQRSLTGSLLGRSIAVPPRIVRQPGFMGFIRSGLGDATAWRAMAHMLISSMTSLVSFVLSVTVLAAGLGCMTYWYWVQWLPAEMAADGSWHRGTLIAPDVYVEGVTWNLIYVALGLVLTFVVWPGLNNGLARLQGALASALLGPTDAQLRLKSLEVSRSHSVEDADARLQQIERDLHDGTQAQLVAIAMKLGDARDRLANKDIDQNVMGLLKSAQATAADALDDLRGLARGIRPAVINDGLDTALESLVAAAPIPVTLNYSLTARPAPAIEAIAYFCAAELINNAVKHSGATRITVKVKTGDNGKDMVLSIVDDGIGGADPKDGSGLRGLVARVSNVDGAVVVSSPVGGPTEVIVALPLS